MSAVWNGREIEQRIAAATKPTRSAVAVTFLDQLPIGVKDFEGSEPSSCSFWRLAAEGRTFYTVPENHFNCAVGAYTHNIPLSPERQKETEHTLKFMFDLGYVKPEDVPQIPRMPKTPKACGAGRRAVCRKAGGRNAARGSRAPRGCWHGRSGFGAADMHGAAGVVAIWNNLEPRMHREPRLYGPE